MEKQSVQVFGRKKLATAVAFCAKGRGIIKVNGVPIELLEPGEHTPPSSRRCVPDLSPAAMALRSLTPFFRG